MKIFNPLILLTVAAIILSSCNDKDHSSEDKHQTDSISGSSQEKETENSSMVFLTNEQVDAIKLEYGSIEKKQLTSSMKANGFLKVPNQNKASATALMGGVVKSISVQPGSFIRKGQTIARIVNTSFIKMQEDLISVDSRLEYAELEYARQKEMNSGNASSQKTLQQSESELKTLYAQRSSLEKQLELIGINTNNLSDENIQSMVSVVSPISGSVSEVLVKIGSYVDPSNVIAEIVDNSQLHLDLFVYEKDLYKLAVGQTVHFTITNNPGKEYDALIFGIGNTFESNTKAVAVHASVKGDKTGLIDGMSITALVSLENATVTAVPTSSIVNFEGQDFIFALVDENAEEEHHLDDVEHDHSESEDLSHEENKRNSTRNQTGKMFERIAVAKGTTDIGYSEITLLKEIPEGSKIVTNGSFFLLGKMTNEGEGHSH
jgi:cobalt-zinc-cadmium efflux system membrane fusion protein